MVFCSNGVSWFRLALVRVWLQGMRVFAIFAEICAYGGVVVTRLHASFVVQVDWYLIEVSRNEGWTAHVS